LTHTPNLCDGHECLIDVAGKANNGLLFVREKRVGGVIYVYSVTRPLTNFVFPSGFLVIDCFILSFAAAASNSNLCRSMFLFLSIQ